MLGMPRCLLRIGVFLLGMPQSVSGMVSVLVRDGRILAEDLRILVRDRPIPTSPKTIPVFSKAVPVSPSPIPTSPKLGETGPGSGESRPGFEEAGPGRGEARRRRGKTSPPVRPAYSLLGPAGLWREKSILPKMEPLLMPRFYAPFPALLCQTVKIRSQTLTILGEVFSLQSRINGKNINCYAI